MDRPSLLAALALGLQWVGTAGLQGGQTVQFHKCLSQPGDSSQQTLQCDLDLDLSIRQDGQIVQSQRQRIERFQQRQVTILAVSTQAPIQARVHFEQSRMGVGPPDADPQVTPQPVTGKTYLVTRQGKELAISYPDGGTPTDEERAVVASNMEAFGLPNPIAQFFHGKSLQVDQTIQLPAKLARELLGFSDTVRSASELTLTLSRVESSADRSPVAVFDIRLRANNPDEGALTMDLSGQMRLEVDTCRTVSVRLAGPVGAAESHGPPAGQFEMHSQGRIDVAVQADYRSARR